MFKAIPVNAPYLANLPILVSTTLAALWVWQTRQFEASTALFLGIIAGGLVDLDNRLTGRLRNVFFTLLHFSAASLLVQFTLDQPWLFAALLTVAALTVTLAGALDVRYRTIAFGTLLVMLYTALTHLPSMAWYTNPVMLVCGTLLYSLCTIVLHLLLPHRPAQENLANACDRLADYMMVKAQFFDPDEADFLAGKEVALALRNSTLTDAFNQCRSALFYRLRSQHRHPRTMRMLQYYLALQNIHERIGARHVDYPEFAHALAHSDLIFRIQRLIVLQAQACLALGEALRHNRDFVLEAHVHRASIGLEQAVARYLADTGAAPIHALRQLTDNVLAISDQLQRLENVRLSDMEQEDDWAIAGQDLERPAEMLQALRSHLNLESAVFRHAVRMAMLTAVAGALVAALQLHFGYWILLTALIVCQPNYSATTTRLRQRISGTVLGVLVGSALPYFIPNPNGQLLIIVLSSTLFFVFRTARYSFSTFFITVQVLAGFTLIGLDTHAAVWSRLADTLIGAGLAWLAVSYLWPDWHYLTLGKTGARALKGNAGYLQQIVDQLQHRHTDNMAYRVARRSAHECATTLGNTVSDMAIEPKKYGDQVQQGFGLLQLNYALLGSIAALGALRGRVAVATLPADFLPRFLHCATALATLMQTTDTRQPQAFQAALADIETELAALKPPTAGHRPDSPAAQVLWAQLQRIAEQLPPYFRILCHILPGDAHAASDLQPIAKP